MLPKGRKSTRHLIVVKCFFLFKKKTSILWKRNRTFHSYCFSLVLQFGTRAPRISDLVFQTWRHSVLDCSSAHFRLFLWWTQLIVCVQSTSHCHISFLIWCTLASHHAPIFASPQPGKLCCLATVSMATEMLPGPPSLLPRVHQNSPVRSRQGLSPFKPPELVRLSPPSPRSIRPLRGGLMDVLRRAQVQYAPQSWFWGTLQPIHA